VVEAARGDHQEPYVTACEARPVRLARPTRNGLEIRRASFRANDVC